jgi:hypothetical protein|tara:strand:+ start:499 stop:921 length:423 start_codon:yes stop_codon:yes gene_type:complete
MSEITLYDYLAYNVPDDCQDILARYDIPEAQSFEELTDNVKGFVRAYGKEALEELATIHPDKELIATLTSFATPFEGKADGDYLNASGTMDRISNIEHSLMTGAGSNDTTVLPTETGITKQDVLLGIGVALLTATLLKDR